MQQSFANLHPETVLDAVEQFGFTVSGQSYPLNSYENRVFQVGLLENPPVIAKFYRPQRWSLETLQAEHQFANSLKQAGVLVAQNLPDTQGNTVHEIAGYHCSLQHKIIGREPELDDLDSLFNIGQTLGKLHKHSVSLASAQSNNVTLQHRPRFNVDNMGRANVDFLSTQVLAKKLTQPWLARYRTVTTKLLEAIHNLLPDNLEEYFIPCHGDCHLSNILMTPDGAFLVDFDDTMHAPAMQDIWMLLAADKKQQLLQLAEIIEGYEESRPFPHEQLAWIPALQALRVLNYNAWLAKRWHDPAFPSAFPWFNSEEFWTGHVKELELLLNDFDQHQPALSGGNY